MKPSRLTTRKERALNAVHILRECHVCEGHKLDEELAMKFLRWFDTKMTRSSPALDEFIERYGLSDDWLMYGNPKGMITGQAKMAHQRAAERRASS